MKSLFQQWLRTIFASKANELPSIKESLFSSIGLNLKTFSSFIGIVFLVWLFVFISSEVEKHPEYEPKHRVEMINSLLKQIRIVDGNQRKTEIDYDQLCEAIGIELSESQKLKNSVESINKTLNSLHTDGYLLYRYAIDIESVKTAIIMGELQGGEFISALTYLSDKSKDLRGLNWSEKQSGFDPAYPPFASVSSGWLSRQNPWIGLPGCVYLAGEAEVDGKTPLYYRAQSGKDSETQKELCTMEEMLPKWGRNSSVSVQSTNEGNLLMPPNIKEIYSDMGGILTMRPKSSPVDLIKDYFNFQQENGTLIKKFQDQNINFHGANVKVAFSSALTLDPDIQTLSQKMALCATGTVKDPSECTEMFSDTIHQRIDALAEKAFVRMVGVAVIDVPTQRIEALASAHTPCYAADYGSGSAKECLPLWPQRNNSDKLRNHAVYGQYQPGSLVKIIEGLGLIRAFPSTYGDVNNPYYQTLKKNMATSTTNYVVGALMCTEKGSGFDHDGQCKGMPTTANAARDLGWNVKCDGDTFNCGKRDILFGSESIGNDDRRIEGTYLGGRLMTNSSKVLDDFSYTKEQIDECMQKNDHDWNKAIRCGELINKVRSEGYGQGNALTSPLGVANMFTRLLAAANGTTYVRDAHIIRDIWDVSGDTLPLKGLRGEKGQNEKPLGKKPLKISQNEALRTVGLFSEVVNLRYGGTAHDACKEVFCPKGKECSECTNNTHIVGKTGTPGSSDTFRMVALRECKSGSSNAMCVNRPIKGFVMGVRDDNGKFTKVIAVMVERNWKMDDKELDNGSNPAAIVALQIYKVMKEKQE